MPALAEPPGKPVDFIADKAIRVYSIGGMKKYIVLGAITSILLVACSTRSDSETSTVNIQPNDFSTIQVEDDSLLPPGAAYKNQFLPQDFSLKLPYFLGNSDSQNTIDLGRCYLDAAPSSGVLDSHTRRICGLQFSQIQLELRALFLDLVLPDIRAFCKNKIKDCNLQGREFTVTISEPVMRRINQLFEFYQYVGLGSYFQYNGYSIKNGAKIPFRINTYQESETEPYDYKASIVTRIIGTYAGEAQTRDNAGEVIIYWNKQRHDILLDFKTSVELFGFQINLRRTYDYSSKLSGMSYTSKVHYWSNIDDAIVYGNAMAVERCGDDKHDCIKVRNIASEFLGDDIDLNGLEQPEAFYNSMRFSEAVIDANGGIIDNYYSVSGNNSKDRLIFSGKETTNFLWQAQAGQPGSLVMGSQPATGKNVYFTSFATASRLNIEMQAGLFNAAIGLSPFNLYWMSSNAPEEVTHVTGYAISGSNLNLILSWKGPSNFHRSEFAFDGTQQYTPLESVNTVPHPLF